MTKVDPETAAPPPSLTARVVEYARQLGPVVTGLVIASLLVPMLLGFLVLAQALADPTWLRPSIDELGLPLAAVLAGVVFGVTTGSKLLPTYALSVASGAVFADAGGSTTDGFLLGGLVAMAGVVLGTLVGYAWGALLARKRVLGVLGRDARAAFVRSEILGKPIWKQIGAITLLRLPPNSPFALTNLLLSSTGVRLVPYAIGSAIGIAPRTLFAVWLGAAASQLTSNTWVRIGSVVVALIVFGLLYKIFVGWIRQALWSFDGRCSCGYDLSSAADAPVCPECGAATPAAP